MKVDNLTLMNYRNIRNMDLCPCPTMNLIYGDNAQGKTNLMEAIWLFTGHTSFRGARTSELVAFHEKSSHLTLSFSDKQRTQKAELFVGEKRKILLNHIELKTLSELNGNFYSVVFSPSHLSLIKDGPKARRKFIDIAISQIKPQYQNYLSLYEKIIEQRNALLKNSKYYFNLKKEIDIWDLQLAKAGTILSIYRNDYINKLTKIVGKIYQGFCKKKEELSIAYESSIFDDKSCIDTYDEKTISLYYQRLKKEYELDSKQGFTGVGVHRDDLSILVGNHPVKIYGSQGQQRSSVIALKLGEAELLKKVAGESPIMLLDDVMSELDLTRQDYIMNHLQDMQVFITCCDIADTMKLKAGSIFKIEEGHFIDEKKI